ncbi:uncharacterized protein LOC142341456 [Convolutriloba macropyga]|uniref:uncharacterized protein LOC142341456 n=1 Tax=Convolutriloba macropyga TaxID=536237 RepID=UPI003F5246D1
MIANSFTNSFCLFLLTFILLVEEYGVDAVDDVNPNQGRYCLFSDAPAEVHETPDLNFLSCQSNCNTTNCTFSQIVQEQFTFRIETKCSTEKLGLHSKLTAHPKYVFDPDSDHLGFITIDQFMKNESVLFDDSLSESEGLQNYPWAVLHTVHHDDISGHQYLMISVGKAVGTSSMDLMAFKPLSSYSRTIENAETLCADKCSRHYVEEDQDTVPGVGETEEESDIDSETEDQQPDFNLGNCDSIQLTNFPPEVSVKVDQQLTCSDWGGNLYVMSYRVDLSMGGLVSVFVSVYHITEVERGLVTVRLDESKSFLFSEEPDSEYVMMSSYVGIGLTNALEIEAVWVSTLLSNKDRSSKRAQINAKMEITDSCEVETVEDNLDDAITLNETIDHVVCNSFSNAIELSNHRRANEHRSGRVRFSNSKVTINCMSQGCTEALCHINIQTPSNDVKTESEVSTDERYDLYVQFAIPVCHQHIIVYKVYNETTNQKQTILQEGVISSIEGSHYHPVTVGVGSSKFYLSGSVYSLLRGNNQPQVRHTLSNLYFVMEECLLMMDRSHKVFPQSVASNRCFRRAARGHNLIMLSVPATLCDVSVPLSSNQCEDLSRHMENPTAGAGSGSFLLSEEKLLSPSSSSAAAIGIDLLAKNVNYKCSVGEDCEGIACFYDVQKSRFEYLRSSSPAYIIYNQAAINFRFDHCSDEEGLIVTVENLASFYFYDRAVRMGHNAYMNVNVTSQFFPTTLNSELSPENVAGNMSDWASSKLSILVAVVGGDSVEFEPAWVLPVVTTTATPKKLAGDTNDRFLSIYFKFKTGELIRQVDHLPIGNAPCDTGISTTVSCHKWKDAAAKFDTPLNKALFCHANEYCSGFACTKRTNQMHSTLTIEVATCVQTPHVLIKEVDVERKKTSQVYMKGDKIGPLNDAYFADYKTFEDCFVLVLKSAPNDKSYMANVMPRNCPKLKRGDPGYIQLERCPESLSKVLFDETTTFDQVHFNYTLPQNNQPVKYHQEDESGVGAYFVPLMVGFVAVPLIAVLFACVSVALCRRSGNSLMTTVRNHNPISLNGNFSSMSRFGILKEDEDDDVNFRDLEDTRDEGHVVFTHANVNGTGVNNSRGHIDATGHNSYKAMSDESFFSL